MRFRFAICLLALPLIAFAQSAADGSVETLVRNAEARADALKGQLTGLAPAPAPERVQRYQRDAVELAEGNRERLRAGMQFLAPAYRYDPYADYDDAGPGAIYVAVSLSMPRASLRELARDAHAAQATLVLQGLVENSFAKTQKALKSVFEEGEAAGLVVDPRVFRQYHVTTVPSFILAPSDIEPCEQGLDCARPDVPFDVVRGNIPLRRALRLLAEKGDAAPQVAQRALDRMGD